ncbi:MAG: hypothetical protein K2X77_25360, partial [Candidatus Obscuribacterales bacterium]|nr:hypothetical protein [Candidatus Obscuribacterales bacterium]
ASILLRAIHSLEFGSIPGAPASCRLLSFESNSLLGVRFDPGSAGILPASILLRAIHSLEFGSIPGAPASCRLLSFESNSLLGVRFDPGSAGILPASILLRVWSRECQPLLYLLRNN